MSDGTAETRKLDLGNAAAVTVLVVSIIGAAFLLYYLIDIVILLFLGIVVAAAVQPGHVRLCRLGLPKGLSVFLIYLLFAAAIILMGLLVVPVLIEEISKFASALPEITPLAVRHCGPAPFLYCGSSGRGCLLSQHSLRVLVCHLRYSLKESWVLRAVRLPSLPPSSQCWWSGSTGRWRCHA